MDAVQTFEVSLKAFIIRADGCALVLREADTGFWELPGGRIDVGEEWVSHDDVLRREIAEELGAGFAVDIEPHAESWVRQRPTDGVFQIVLARVCALTEGDVILSDEHQDARWITSDAIGTLEWPPLSGYPDGLKRLFAHGAHR
jgi:8-oxo-dGTP diphosphatase